MHTYRATAPHGLQKLDYDPNGRELGSSVVTLGPIEDRDGDIVLPGNHTATLDAVYARLDRLYYEITSRGFSELIVSAEAFHPAAARQE